MTLPPVQAPPAATAQIAPGAVIDPELARSKIDFSTWTLDDILSGTRMALEFTRIIPGLGAITGLAADVTGGYQDMKAIPKGSFPLTEALILLRTLINIGNNVLGHVKYVTELIQDGLAGSTILAEFLPVSANAIELEALVKVYLDGALFIVDAGVEIGALYNQSQVDPKSQEFKDWQALIDGYQANLIGDVVGTALDIAALASAGAANTGAIKEVTAMFPLGRLLINKLGTIAIQYAQSIFNVYGGSAPGVKGEQFPNKNKNVGPAKGATSNVIGVPGASGGGIGKKSAEAVALLAAADIISGETSQARISWKVVDTGIGMLEVQANERLAELDVIIKKLSGGKGLFEVIRDASLQSMATMRARLDQITQFEAMATQGRTKAEEVRGKADGVLAKIDAFTVPDVNIPDVDLGDGVLADLAASAINEAKNAANVALRATVGKVRESAETAKGEVRAPVEAVRDKTTEFIDVITIAEKFSVQQKATISKYADNLEKGLKQASGFEGAADVLIAQFSALMGLPAFKIQDIRDEWAAIPGYLDRLDVVATNMRAHAKQLQEEEDETAVPVASAAGVPPKKP